MKRQRDSSFFVSENKISPKKSYEEVVLQIPSKNDLTHMRGLPAGIEDEDQQKRLDNMSESILKLQKKFSWLNIITTDTPIPKYWYKLFDAISLGDEASALRLFDKIPKDDVSLEPLLRVHPAQYLKQIIKLCCSAVAMKEQRIEYGNDIVITPGVFEIFIKDLFATILSKSKLHFSFNLPSHHAGKESKGFCIFDKTLVVFYANLEQLDSALIIGGDINRDDGLFEHLKDAVLQSPVKHLDMFDSRVYPYQDYSYISREFKFEGKQSEGIMSWKKDNYEYYAVDLSIVHRQERLHPAIIFVVDTITKHIQETRQNNKKTMIFLPTGWDSHMNETASCGKFVGDHMLTEKESRKFRFQDPDLKYFYDRLFQLYEENSDYISGIYWGLEGGYAKPMYDKQIELLIEAIDRQFNPEKKQKMEERFGKRIQDDQISGNLTLK